MSKSCNHRDNFGNSLIEDDYCTRCKTKFGKQYLKKNKEINKMIKYKKGVTDNYDD